MVGTCRRRGLARLAACAIIVAATLLFAPRPAEAQFVCGGSATGAEPQTGDGATATGLASTACGHDAEANGQGATVFGDQAGANSVNALGSAYFGPNAGLETDGHTNSAFGEAAGAEGTGNSNVSMGSGAGRFVFGDSNTTVGTASGTNVNGNTNSAFGDEAGRFLTGSDNVAIGHNAGRGVGELDPLIVSNAVAVGNAALAGADGATATGTNSSAGGSLSAAYGAFSTASGASSVAIGDSAQATAASAIALGQNAAATGTNAIAIGTGAVATGSIAAGTNAYASNGGAAFGDFSMASGASSTAVGPSASAAYDNSAAFGNGATAVRANQQVFGTASNTYTMPGVTSSASKAAQGAPTHVVTSNASGDLAAYTPSELGLATTADLSSYAKQTDLNAINRRLAKVDDEKNSGIALAVAMQNPDLTGSERIGVAANWGAFEDANAFGMSMMGVLGHDFVSRGDRVAISGAFGVGLENGDGDSVYGGRVGLQWTH